jgi:iron complex outermembrane receptor protein
MKSVFNPIILFFLFLIPVSIQAQNSRESSGSDLKSILLPKQSYSLEDTTINLQEIVIKAFQSDKRLLDTPATIGIINNRQLEREPAFNLAPSVNKIAGVWMQSGSLNTNRLTIRGIGTRSPYGTNKIRAYYGDIPLTNGVGETTLEDLDLGQISNIEIIKGPSSGFYGSGLGGVLLFHPTKPKTDRFDQQISVGSYNTIKYTGKLALSNNNSGHSLVYSRIHSDGYRENNETNRHNLTWTSTYSQNRTQIDLLAAFVKMDAFIPSSIDLKTFQEKPEMAATSWAATKGYEDYQKLFGGISIQKSFNKNWKSNVSGFGQVQRNNELRPFNILQENSHSLGYRSLTEKKYSTEKSSIRAMLGTEFFIEKYNWQTLQNKERTAGNLLSDNQESRLYTNIFFVSHLTLSKKFVLSASLNLNKTKYTYHDLFLTNGDQSGTHKYKPVISPRLAFNWMYSEKISFFALVSHGFSPPTLEETLMPGGLRNTSIKPETGWNLEVGTKGSVFKSLYFEVSAYYMKVRNLLVSRRAADDEYIGINAGTTNHPGLEFKLDYQLVDKPSWSSFIRMNTNLTNYHFAEFIDNGMDYSGNKLTGTPSSITNWMLETSHAKGLFLNLHYQTVGRMPMRDDNTLFTDAYQLANLMAGYEKSFKKLSISLSSGIQNLFDIHYASMILINATSFGSQSPRYFYPGLPRNFKSAISLRYSF